MALSPYFPFMRWEYKVIRLRGWTEAKLQENIQQELNELGRQGWELVGVELMRAYLKRPLP